MLWVVLASVFISVVVRAVRRRQVVIRSQAPLDDPRWSNETRPQIAGRTCVECGAKVIVAADGDACNACGEIGHVKKCLAQHVRSAHRVQSHIPYR